MTSNDILALSFPDDVKINTLIVEIVDVPGKHHINWVILNRFVSPPWRLLCFWLRFNFVWQRFGFLATEKQEAEGKHVFHFNSNGHHDMVQCFIWNADDVNVLQADLIFITEASKRIRIL